MYAFAFVLAFGPGCERVRHHKARELGADAGRRHPLGGVSPAQVMGFHTTRLKRRLIAPVVKCGGGAV